MKKLIVKYAPEVWFCVTALALLLVALLAPRLHAQTPATVPTGTVVVCPATSPQPTGSAALLWCTGTYATCPQQGVPTAPVAYILPAGGTCTGGQAGTVQELVAAPEASYYSVTIPNQTAPTQSLAGMVPGPNLPPDAITTGVQSLAQQAGVTLTADQAAQLAALAGAAAAGWAQHAAWVAQQSAAITKLQAQLAADEKLIYTLQCQLQAK